MDKDAAEEQLKNSAQIVPINGNLCGKIAHSEEVEQELKDMVHYLKHVSLAHNLLNAGMFSMSRFQAVDQVVSFLKVCYEQCRDKIFEHPQHMLIAEIVELKKEHEVKNAKKEEQKNVES